MAVHEVWFEDNAVVFEAIDPPAALIERVHAAALAGRQFRGRRLVGNVTQLLDALEIQEAWNVLRSQLCELVGPPAGSSDAVTSPAAESPTAVAAARRPTARDQAVVDAGLLDLRKELVHSIKSANRSLKQLADSLRQLQCEQAALRRHLTTVNRTIAQQAEIRFGRVTGADCAGDRDPADDRAPGEPD